jgi:hypothetical protein
VEAVQGRDSSCWPVSLVGFRRARGWAPFLANFHTQTRKRLESRLIHRMRFRSAFFKRSY